MALVQTIVDNGFSLSVKTRPEMIPLQEQILCRVLNTAQRALFQYAARVNPTALSTQTQGAAIGGRWNRPSDVESLFRIEGVGASTTPAITGEVKVVPYDDREAFAGEPSVYAMGPHFYTSGNAGDPTGGLLTFFYSRVPPAITSYASTTDAAVPDDFTAFYEFELAAFLARADGGRDGELQLMVQERNRVISMFEAWLDHLVVNQSRRVDYDRVFATERRSAMNALMGTLTPAASK